MPDTDGLSVVSKYGPDSFEVQGFPRVLWEPMGRITDENGVRIAERGVPWVDGAQLDEQGLLPRVLNCEIWFFNDIAGKSPDIGASPVMYPDRMELLLRIFATRKTGTLNIYGRRNIRAKAIKWSRVESADQLDGAILSVTWKTDNEGRLDADEALGAGVSATLQTEVTAAQFDAQKLGMDGGDFFLSLNESVGNLVTAMNTPKTFRSDIATKAGIVRHNCDRILGVFGTRSDGRNGMNRPEAAGARRRLMVLKQLAARAEAEARARGQRVKTIVVKADTSLWAIAPVLGTTGDNLIELNPGIADPNDVPAGARVVVPNE